MLCAQWAVRSYGAERASRRFETKQEATEYAVTLARKRHAELYVHGRDGSVEEYKQL